MWGGNDDYQKAKPKLVQYLTDTSAPLPDDVVVISAAHLRDAEFQVPDPECDLVIVHGGFTKLANSYGQSNQMLACHFMPLLSESQSRALGDQADDKKLVSDMTVATAA